VIKLKKTSMLKKNYEFKKVLTSGKYWGGNYLDIFIMKNNFNTNMLGIAVGKKTGNSVKRNFIKRRIRENYRLLEEKIISGYSLVILWKKRNCNKDMAFFYIKNDMERILKKAKLLKE